MSFIKFLVRFAELTFGLHHWGQEAQIPLSGIQTSHSVIETKDHDYIGSPDRWFCNTPGDRACWIDGRYARFDINTDYEAWWPQGVTREYWLEVTYKEAAPDGFVRKYTLVNGTFPGPLIEANWGDELVIHVTSYLEDDTQHFGDNGTTIHWHGIRQWLTTEADGVNGVTQCPVAPNGTYTYKWRATQYGHSWYHSHYSMQYGNGVLGPLLIHGPTSDNWDVDAGILAVGDLYHDNVFVIFSDYELPENPIGGYTRNMTGTHINGHGHFPCTATEDDPCKNCTQNGGSRFKTEFEQGKKYLLRIVNTSVNMQIRFAIDNHMLRVVQADFVPVVPYDTEYISIGIGQRYEVIVTANPNYTSPFPPKPKVENFWIRTIPLLGCSDMVNTTFPTYGILRYANQPDEEPRSKIFDGHIPPECIDEPAANLVPIVPWQIGDSKDNQTLDVGISKDLYHGFKRWELFNTPLWLNWGEPSITALGNTSWNEDYNVVLENLGPSTEWVYFIIQGSFQSPDRRDIKTAHPIHLHGHDFAILAQGNGTFEDAVQEGLTLNWDNPARRDVALLDNFGHLVIAWRTDNPGIWLMHCHIAWHASSGLALQIIERQNEIANTIVNPEQIHETCEQWKAFVASGGPNDPVIFQDDSGI